VPAFKANLEISRVHLLIGTKTQVNPVNTRAKFLACRDDLQNRRKPSIQLDKEDAIAVRKPDAQLCSPRFARNTPGTWFQNCRVRLTLLLAILRGLIFPDLRSDRRGILIVFDWQSINGQRINDAESLR
jgi:hypothetical protein